jgi:cytoskeletal protein CcmA (bactofilin family)
MAIWKETTSPRKETNTMAAEPALQREETMTTPAAPAAAPTNYDIPRRAPERTDAKESVIAADLTIEGKIEGSGHVRLAGKFKGDVRVDGNLTIEAGAKLTGGVRASTVIIKGELEGNIDAASRVELLDGGILVGDVKAGSLTVAAGSRMRGSVDFGWGDEERSKPKGRIGLDSTQ